MCIKAIRASTKGTFADGWEAERQIARVVFSSGQSYAMAYSYFTTFQASQVGYIKQYGYDAVNPSFL